MNYIHQLKAEVARQAAELESLRNSLHSFRCFLHSPKFTGTDTDGERKDWISTSDVLIALREMDTAAVIAGENSKANYNTTIKKG